MNLSDFHGKTIWLFGGAGYLGASIMRGLDEAGARVICVDLPGRAAEMMKKLGLQNTLAEECDILRTEAISPFCKELTGKYGVPAGAVLLAATWSTGKSVEKIGPEDFDRTFRGSVTANFLLAREAAEAMATAGSGSVVLFSSMYGLVAPDARVYNTENAEPLSPNPIDYGAAKASIVQMTKYLAMHYGPRGIRVNCIAPGPFPSLTVQKEHPDFVRNLQEKTMLRRVGGAGEITGPTLFLLSSGASFVTGHCLVVDGGWTAW